MYVQQVKRKKMLMARPGSTFSGGGTGLWTYSWRTGPNAVSNYSDPVYKPAGGGLLNTLRDRKEYIENLMENASDTGSYQDEGVFEYDKGHTFASIRYTATPTRASLRRVGDLTPFMDEVGYVDAPVVPAFFRKPAGVSSSGFNGSGFPSTIPQSLINQQVGRVVPKNIGIGETIVELVRGDIPGLISDLRRSIARLSKLSMKDLRRKEFTTLLRKGSIDPEVYLSIMGIIDSAPLKPKWLKSAGSDYLEIQFGMYPVLRSVIQACLLLSDTTDSIYGTSFRRKIRSFPNVWTRTSNMVSNGRSSLTLSNGFLVKNPVGGSVTNGGFGNGQSPVTASLTTDEKWDLDISLRATAAGRPSVGTLDFMSRAPDVIQKLGLWYPSLGWDLIPYSWLVDWVLHLGSAIDNASFLGKQGVYPVDYAYGTFKAVHVSYYNFFAPSPIWSGSPWGTVDQSESDSVGTAVTTSLYRTRINPFGFAVDGSPLTTTQKAILIALGLAKKR